jgi:maltose/moltooligosaccharide transporter
MLLAMIGVGIAWASILSIPYAMLSGALPSNKMGYYMGVFNFFVVIPQIVAGTILGFLVNEFFNRRTHVCTDRRRLFDDVSQDC